MKACLICQLQDIMGKIDRFIDSIDDIREVQCTCSKKEGLDSQKSAESATSPPLELVKSRNCICNQNKVKGVQKTESICEEKNESHPSVGPCGKILCKAINEALKNAQSTAKEQNESESPAGAYGYFLCNANVGVAPPQSGKICVDKWQQVCTIKSCPTKVSKQTSTEDSIVYECRRRHKKSATSLSDKSCKEQEEKDGGTESSNLPKAWEINKNPDPQNPVEGKSVREPLAPWVKRLSSTAQRPAENKVSQRSLKGRHTSKKPEIDGNKLKHDKSKGNSLKPLAQKENGVTVSHGRSRISPEIGETGVNLKWNNSTNRSKSPDTVEHSLISKYVNSRNSSKKRDPDETCITMKSAISRNSSKNRNPEVTSSRSTTCRTRSKCRDPEESSISTRSNKYRCSRNNQDIEDSSIISSSTNCRNTFKRQDTEENSITSGSTISRRSCKSRDPEGTTSRKIKSRNSCKSGVPTKSSISSRCIKTSKRSKTRDPEDTSLTSRSVKSRNSSKSSVTEDNSVAPCDLPVKHGLTPIKKVYTKRVKDKPFNYSSTSRQENPALVPFREPPSYKYNVLPKLCPPKCYVDHAPASNCYCEHHQVEAQEMLPCPMMTQLPVCPVVPSSWPMCTSCNSHGAEYANQCYIDWSRNIEFSCPQNQYCNSDYDVNFLNKTGTETFKFFKNNELLCGDSSALDLKNVKTDKIGQKSTDDTPVKNQILKSTSNVCLNSDATLESIFKTCDSIPSLDFNKLGKSKIETTEKTLKINNKKSKFNYSENNRSKDLQRFFRRGSKKYKTYRILFGNNNTFPYAYVDTKNQV